MKSDTELLKGCVWMLFSAYLTLIAPLWLLPLTLGVGGYEAFHILKYIFSAHGARKPRSDN